MALKKVDYDGRQHTVYAAGRTMPDEVKTVWMAAFARRLPDQRPLPIIDLGCGIGRLTPALATTFGGPVYGVDPSAKMLQIARQSANHPDVTYLAGEAADIPLPDDAASGVLMYLSLHHVADRRAAAIEITRVLRPGGRVLIVSGFSDRMPFGEGGGWWHRFFPRAYDIEREMFSSVAELAADFAPAGLRPIAIDQVPIQYWSSVAEAADKLRLRPYSTFEHLTEAEIAEGLKRLEAAAADDQARQPIMGNGEMMVLG